ncbi:hypothetical protein pb186bvf_020521 [Paramecium bursaria]
MNQTKQKLCLLRNNLKLQYEKIIQTIEITATIFKKYQVWLKQQGCQKKNIIVMLGSKFNSLMKFSKLFKKATIVEKVKHCVRGCSIKGHKKCFIEDYSFKTILSEIFQSPLVKMLRCFFIKHQLQNCIQQLSLLQISLELKMELIGLKCQVDACLIKIKY